MFIEERQARIYQLLKQKQRIEVTELTRLLSVSPDTIRRDLKDMEIRGLLTRTHGGAMLSDKTGYFTEYPAREEINNEIKNDIAMQATKFIEDGDTLFLESSTTVTALALQLGNFKDLTVFTNSIDIAQSLLKISNTITVNVTGGPIHRPSKSMVGEFALKFLDEIYVDKSFISACSISSKWGLSNPIGEEIAFQKKLLKISKETYILAEKSKFEKKSTYKITDISPGMTIITDGLLDNDILNNFQKYLDAGTKIIQSNTLNNNN